MIVAYFEESAPSRLRLRTVSVHEYQRVRSVATEHNTRLRWESVERGEWLLQNYHRSNGSTGAQLKRIRCFNTSTVSLDS